jgi:hypothetical protein
MKRLFEYEFEQDAQKDRITFEYSPDADEKLDVLIENGKPILYLNRPGMLTLAKILIKIAGGHYSEQFHVHLYKDFNADKAETLTLMLYPDDAATKSSSDFKQRE